MRKIFGSVILLCFIFSNIFCQTISNSISGSVTDKETGEGILNCNIFLSGTSWGTTSDPDGIYKISSVIPSQYEIVFSMIGYETESVFINFDNNAHLNIDIELSPTAYNLDEVVVTSDEPEEWKNNLKIFKKYFLGTSEFSKDCIIKNKAHLNFSNPSENILKASINQPMMINNLALGFDISCELKKFEYNSDEKKVEYIVSTHFTFHDTSDVDILEKWNKNRYRAYKGSIDHFLNCLNKNTFMDEGFEVSTSLIPRVKGNDHYRARVFSSEPLLSDGYYDEAKSLSFGHYLQIKYNQSGEVKAPVSWLKLIGSDVTLDKYGVPEDIMPFKVYGKWATRGVSSMLPKYYYVLNNNNYDF